MSTSEAQELDYDFIVESFKCEYKLDVARLKEIVQTYKITDDKAECSNLQSEFFSLWPECTIKNISEINPSSIPPTITKELFFVQSPKGSNGLPSVHYSLKEKMLSDFRATRKKVKHDEEEAEHADNKVEAIRLHAKQLAIKVVCNSEYGASNNEHFAHYDPDIAAAVTFAARKLIGFLTCNLETDHLYVDRKFISDNQKPFNWLYNAGVIDVQPYRGTDENLFQNRRHVLGRIFDLDYNVVNHDVIQIDIKRSSVVYQDTDSNYYINQHIIDTFTRNPNYPKLLSTDFNTPVDLDTALQNQRTDTQHWSTELTCSPTIIDLCMHSMLYHNELLANFIADGVNRKPVGLGFEGSFIVCRYLNRKKKYYGVKWSADGTDIPATKLPNELAYTDSGVLIPDYLPYWIPKKTVIPQPNGEYIKMTDELHEVGVNYLDYVKKYNVKCTGVDLVRRDQYKFINWFHVFILQKDLRLMSYEGDGKWHVFPKDSPMVDIIDTVVDRYKTIIKSYNDIAKFIKNEPPIKFTIFDFAKTAAYRPNKPNSIIAKVVERLKSEAERQLDSGIPKEETKEKYICGIGERMTYIIIVDETLRKLRAEGRPDTNTTDRAYIIDEVLDDLKVKYPKEKIENEIKTHDLDITYDDWINAKVITMLDDKYYLQCLCKSIALYIIGDKFPNEMKNIDEGLISSAEANELVSKCADKIAKEYVDRFYASNKVVSKNRRNYEKFEKNGRKAIESKTDRFIEETGAEVPEYIKTACKYFNCISMDQLNPDFKNMAIGTIVPKMEDNTQKLDMLKVIKNLIDDGKEPKYLNRKYKNIYKAYCNKVDELEKQIENRLLLKIEFEKVFDELQMMKFDRNGRLMEME